MDRGEDVAICMVTSGGPDDEVILSCRYVETADTWDELKPHEAVVEIKFTTRAQLQAAAAEILAPKAESASTLGNVWPSEVM